MHTKCQYGISVPFCHWLNGKRLAAKLKQAGIEFIIEPHIRFRGEPGEQATMFFLDPSGNALEFKSFADMDYIFRK